jgi:ribonuclease BN (tRNA processing enzyme)
MISTARGRRAAAPVRKHRIVSALACWPAADADVVRRLITSRLGAFVAIGAVSVFATPASAQSVCSSEPLAVQVLGSGGPNAGGTRASSGYLVWRAGRAVVMVDAGGGTFLRFGQAGARLQDLSLLAISHLHPDHVSDLPALLWLSELARQQPLKIAGPTGAGAFPSIDAFIRRLFDTSTGAFPILGGTLGQPGHGVRLDLVVADATVGTSSTIWSDNDLEVSAMGVPHGNVPSIAYRVRIGDRSIVFGSDQNGSDERFSSFAAGADALIMHFALSARAPDPIAQIHARPAAVGQAAQKAKAKHLVLSHFIQTPSTVKTPEWFSLSDLGEAVGEARRHFSGRIDTAVDLQCFPVR